MKFGVLGVSGARHRIFNISTYRNIPELQIPIGIPRFPDSAKVWLSFDAVRRRFSGVPPETWSRVEHSHWEFPPSGRSLEGLLRCLGVQGCMVLVRIRVGLSMVVGSFLSESP